VRKSYNLFMQSQSINVSEFSKSITQELVPKLEVTNTKNE